MADVGGEDVRILLVDADNELVEYLISELRATGFHKIP